MQVEEAQWRMVLNSLVICLFARGVYDPQIIADGLKSLGMDWTPERLKQFGAETLKAKYRLKKSYAFDPRGITIPEKMFNVRTSTGFLDRERMARRLDLFMEYAGISREK